MNAPVIAIADALACSLIVELKFQQNALRVARSVRIAVAQSVENFVRTLFLGPHGYQRVHLLKAAVGHASAVAWARAMVVGSAHKADFVPLAEVIVSKPFEGAVHGGDLDQTLEVGVAMAPVPGLVGVR